MSKETIDAMKLAVDRLDNAMDAYLDRAVIDALLEAIDREEAQTVEPIGYFIAEASDARGKVISWAQAMNGHGTALFTHPAPTPSGERHTEEQPDGTMIPVYPSEMRASKPAVKQSLSNEWDEFETWIKSRYKPGSAMLQKDADGDYCHMYTMLEWGGWKARADMLAADAPPQRQPMTDEEAWELTAGQNGISEIEGRELIRQVEDFHGIGVKP